MACCHQLISSAQAVVAISDDRCYLLIAEIDEEPVEILVGYRFPDVGAGGTPLIYRYNVEFLESHRGKGIGKYSLIVTTTMALL